MGFFHQYLLGNAGTEVEGFENDADWSTVNGAVSDDAINKITGTQSVKLITDVGATATITKEINHNFSTTNGQMRLSFFVDEIVIGNLLATVSSITVRLSPDASMSPCYYYTITSPATYGAVRDGWNTITIGASQWLSSPSVPGWINNMVRIQLEVVAKAGQVATVSFDALYESIIGEPAMFLSFDDGYESAYTVAYQVMKEFGLKGTVYVIQDLIGTAGRLTEAQLIEMYGAGWDICNHSKGHDSLNTITQAQCETSIGSCQNYLDGLGFTRSSHHLAYPGGQYSTNTLNACTALGVLTGRSCWTNSCEALLPFSPFRISGQTLAGGVEGQAKIDALITSGAIGSIFGHNLTDYDSFFGYISYMVNRNLPILTISELYAASLGPIAQADQPVGAVVSCSVHPSGIFYIPSYVNGVWTKGEYTYLS